MDTIETIVDRHHAEASALIQILLDVQKQFNWLPPQALKEVGGRLSVPMSRIQHVATFYKAFSMVPKGRHRVNICMGTACHVRGASRILETVGFADRVQFLDIIRSRLPPRCDRSFG